MREYFEAEMRLLYDSAQEFAEAYPEQAGMLNLSEVSDRDPYIERLLEGVAYLTAGIRKRIDDDIPEISENLLAQLWPHFLRPYPSATIMEFAARSGQLQQSQVVEKETVMLSRPVGDEQVICRFRSIADVTLSPVMVSSLTVLENNTGGTHIKLGLQADGGTDVESLDIDSLRIHIHAENSVALSVFHAMVAGVMEVKISFPKQPELGAQRIGGQEIVSPCFMDADESMIPLSGRSFYGFHLLHDYFSFREKFLFFKVAALDKIKWPEDCSDFEIDIKINHQLPANHQLTKESFKLNCVPAVNLFESTSEPVYLSQKRHEYQVVADSAHRHGQDIYSVNEVNGSDVDTGDVTTYMPMYSFKHRTTTGAYFHFSRKDVGGELPASFLAVGGKLDFRKEILSCDITATNANYPRRYLSENSINTPTAGFPSYAYFRNITRPTKMLNPPVRADYQWQLISHLSLNYSSLASAESFKQLLTMYDWTEQLQNKKRIEGVKDIKVIPQDRVLKGALMRGMEVVLDLSEDNYISFADMYLFGQVVHHFLTLYTAINSFVATKIICHPSNQEFVWEPKLGVSYLI
ncbi:Protein ImpG/VasA [hydrothermal vent metagenome]|uniref:Protein ImpG/VasA n=1 Tax=hydrothermal vent metagenome TaxID=652676 RepID=A0A3B0Z638_9ZZZZ